jgi:hypothetical protein
MALAVAVRSGLLACCLLSAAAPGLAQDFLQDAPRKPAAQHSKLPECVSVTTEAAFASVGYDHIVRLKNACKTTVSCSVKTDVNPEPATATLAPGESTSMVTWRGSPAREFKPDVSCETARGGSR